MYMYNEAEMCKVKRKYTLGLDQQILSEEKFAVSVYLTLKQLTRTDTTVKS